MSPPARTWVALTLACGSLITAFACKKQKDDRDRRVIDGPIDAPIDAPIDGARTSPADPVPLAECTSDDACAPRLTATQPPNCAEAACVAGRCVIRARDADRDGARARACKLTGGGPVELGTDCDDARAAVFPGAAETCNATDDDCDGDKDEGVDPQGACSVGRGLCERAGMLECANGTFSRCNAVPGPAESDAPRCDGQDYACDGPAQIGCKCTVGSAKQGRTADAGWDYCARACDTIRQDCVAGTLQPACNAGQGPQPRQYCRDADGDGFYNTGDCGSWCESHSVPAGAPGPSTPTAPAGYIMMDSVHPDCHDGVREIHPGAPERCNGNTDDNCNGDPYDGLVRPGSTQGCDVCGYAGTRTADDSCNWGGCAINDWGFLGFTALNCTGGAAAGCSWNHAWGQPCGDSWCAEGAGTDFVVFGPYVTLPPGNYTVHFSGKHGTSSTWFDVNEVDGRGEIDSRHVAESAPWPTHQFDVDIFFNVPQCGRYEFRIRATHHWSIHYGIKVDSITLTRS